MNTFVSTISCVALAGPIRSVLIKDIKGLENIPKKENFILASNHLSHMDWLMSGYICAPRKFTFISQVDQDTGFNKLLRNLMYFYGDVIPVNRKSDESKIKAVNTAIKMLERGYRLVIYPEGGRAYDGVMRQFKFGVGKLHLESGAPVLPASFSGTRELLPPHGKLKIKKTVRISIGEPMDFKQEREAIKNMDRESQEYRLLCADVAKKIEDRVRELSK
jgi:1-acyl-sn-glycerol-3-phosphate acyltransferase